MPFAVKDKCLDLSIEDAKESIRALNILGELCKKYFCKAIIHAEQKWRKE